MLFWTLTFFIFIYGVSELSPVWLKLKLFLNQGAHILELRRSAEHLKLLTQILETGLVPEDEDWQKIKLFPHPWGALIFQSVTDLRDQGAPILPTLHRMQMTLGHQIEQIQEAKVKSAQAFGQSVMSTLMILLTSVALYFLLPGIEKAKSLFLSLFLFALFLNSLSFIWMIALAEQARFANLSSEKRKWMVSVDAAIDRLIALISTGLPPDLSWKKTLEELCLTDRELAHAWGLLVWDTEFQKPNLSLNDTERLMVSTGIEVKRSIQTSLVEGRPCLDRIESVQRAFQLDLKMMVSKELNLLPNRCLKPLFIFVLPSFLVLLGGSFFLTLGDLLA